MTFVDVVGMGCARVAATALDKVAVLMALLACAAHVKAQDSMRKMVRKGPQSRIDSPYTHAG